MDLSPAVSSLTSSPSTGEDRGEGALIFFLLTLALPREGEREPVSPHRSTTEIFCRIEANYSRARGHPEPASLARTQK
jgi:hypothetical protein